MLKILRFIGFALLIPGVIALGYSLWNGPECWYTDSKTFWGTPIALFVFWIGLAHAGTLLSAIFLVLNVDLDKRTTLIAEFSTLTSLCVAAVFPLVHLGVIKNFYMVAPFLDFRGTLSNLGSPLVWDFCCIFAYGALSALFFFNHLYTKKHVIVNKIHKPLAWLLLPLVLWVHSVVSLDFATTFVPEWKGAFFPVYFVVGAIYSGLALVNALLCAEGYRVRLLEKIMLIASWFICIIWLWDYLVKGTFFTWTFIFAGLLPQLMWLPSIKERKRGRFLICFFIFVGLFLERLYLVSPDYEQVSSQLHLVDVGLIAFSVGLFLTLFYGCRNLLEKYFENYNTYYGEIDGSEVYSDVSKSASRNMEQPYNHLLSSEEFKVLRLPLLLGILVVVLFSIWALNQPGYNLTFVNILPLTYPIVALVAALCMFVFAVRDYKEIPKKYMLIIAALFFLVGCICGIFYVGYSTDSNGENVKTIDVKTPENPKAIALLWNSRCSFCHGLDGKMNYKFVREYYPIPTKLTVERLDSLGKDSLYQVILKGRNNMNPYQGRLSDKEIKGLVLYMEYLAKENLK